MIKKMLKNVTLFISEREKLLLLVADKGHLFMGVKWYFHEMFTAVIHHIYQALPCPSLHPAELALQLLYAVVAQTCAAISRSIRASSLTSSRREYRLGVLLCRNSLSSLESLGRWAAFSWACWYASSARRTTSWTSWLRPWERGFWGSALWWGLLLMTLRFRQSAWQSVERTEIRTCGEQRTQTSHGIPQYYQWN